MLSGSSNECKEVVRYANAQKALRNAKEHLGTLWNANEH